MRTLFSLTRLLTTLILVISVGLGGCATNPVTGERQLMLSSVNDDIAIGQQQYQPAQQAQGGVYYLDPALNAYVSGVGKKLAAVSDQPDLPYEFVILNNSVPNAWALPGGKIAINRGLLLALESEAQLAAVLGHEIVHSAARHGAQRMRDQQLLQIGLAGIGLGLADNDYRSLIVGGAALGAQLITAKYGRDHEFESDHYGMEYMTRAGYNPQGAVALQQLFVKLAAGRNGSWLEGLFASHPPSQARVARNQAKAQSLGNTGIVGREQYQQAIAGLAAKQPAYALADQAAHAMQQGEFTRANQLLDQAIAKVPNEALFHSLKGKALEQLGQSQQALASHNRATELYPAQFSYFLHRADTLQSLGKHAQAQQDLERSMALLPTSVASLQLGQYAEQRGGTQEAMQYYQQAAQASGSTGQQASERFVRLDMQQRPERYGELEHRQDPNGPLLIRVRNRAPVSVQQLIVVSEHTDSQGKLVSSHRWQIDEMLAPGAYSRFYPLETVYHLPHGDQIRSRVVQMKPANTQP